MKLNLRGTPSFHVFLLTLAISVCAFRDSTPPLAVACDGVRCCDERLEFLDIHYTFTLDPHEFPSSGAQSFSLALSFPPQVATVFGDAGACCIDPRAISESR